MKVTPRIPSYLSDDTANLLDHLLKKNPEERIGFSGEFNELKAHPFFNKINW